MEWDPPALPAKKPAVFHHPHGVDLWDGPSMDLHAMRYAEAAVAAERARGECGSGAGCLHKVATIEHQAAEIERLTADRDSWAQQASDRVADCAQYLAEIERLRSSIRGFVDRQMQYYDGLATITVSRGAVLAARDLLGPNVEIEPHLPAQEQR